LNEVIVRGLGMRASPSPVYQRGLGNSIDRYNINKIMLNVKK